MVFETVSGANMPEFTVTYFLIQSSGILSVLGEKPVCGMVP